MQCTGNSGCFPRGKRIAIVRRYPVFWVFSCVQWFRVSVIHRTLTWTTGSLTCVLPVQELLVYIYIYISNLCHFMSRENNVQNDSDQFEQNILWNCMKTIATYDRPDALQELAEQRPSLPGLLDRYYIDRCLICNVRSTTEVIRLSGPV